MHGLTSRQAQVLRIIETSISVRGFPPALREIGAEMGIRSTNGVNDHLRALERKGYIDRREGLSRGIRLRRQLDELTVEDAPGQRPPDLCMSDMYRAARLAWELVILDGDISVRVEFSKLLARMYADSETFRDVVKGAV